MRFAAAGLTDRARKSLAWAAARTSRRLSIVLGRPRLTWAVKISAPDDWTGDVWGDVFYADDLAASLRRLGQTVYVDRFESRRRPVQRVPDDVVVHLVGLRPPVLVPGAVNILWVISHPELLGDAELGLDWAARFAASVDWAERMSVPGREVQPLLQATDPGRFHPEPGEQDIAALFVGKTRAVFRPIIRDALEVGADLTIYGDGWEEFIDTSYVAAEFLDNAEVPAAYRRARVVLNDHWDDMARDGFVSNRLFDAVATGARVISDDVRGLPTEFGGSVQIYRSTEELAALLDPASPRWPSPAALLLNAAATARAHSFDDRARALLATALSARRGRPRSSATPPRTPA